MKEKVSKSEIKSLLPSEEISNIKTRNIVAEMLDVY